MSVISILFGRKYSQTRIATVLMDATISEDYQYTSRATNFPIEIGSQISDHIIKDPLRVSISGIVSDTPLSLLARSNRSIDAFNRLIRIYETREVVTVITGIKVYTNMCMTQLNVPRNVNSGQSLVFNLEFQQLKIDSSVRLQLRENDPFGGVIDTIPREIVADADKYPFHGGDPVTSLKDQASSPVDIGIQDLQPIPPSIAPRVEADGLLILNGGV